MAWLMVPASAIAMTLSVNDINLMERVPGQPSAGFSGAGVLTVTAAVGVAYTLDFRSFNPIVTNMRMLKDYNVIAHSSLGYNLYETGTSTRLGLDVGGVLLSSVGTGSPQYFNVTIIAPVGDFGQWSDVITLTVNY